MIVTIKYDVYLKLKGMADQLNTSVPEVIRREISKELGLPIPKVSSRKGRKSIGWVRNGSSYVTVNVTLPHNVEVELRKRNISIAKLLNKRVCQSMVIMS
ncbi:MULTISPECIES: hypothetical protein [Thermoprotei]|uniref:hypothetical protein n=1 Tax=Thermoprotei TaxID=183924 RepID=UPI00316735D0